MEHTLRCNSLKCRKELNDHAVVTTCSHVFCIDCSNSCQLSGQREGQRPICPACDMHLPNPDDVVVTNLNPTEDYKTSVLSGLSPNVIMECAGRALSFWAYQTTQEIVYQEYLGKNLTDKYSTLSTQMDKIIHEANGEISNLRSKLSNMQLDQEGLRRKNEELIQNLREKTRKHLQTQELYDKLKRRAMLGQVQSAASDAVDHTIQASTSVNRFAHGAGNQNREQRPLPPLFPRQPPGGTMLLGSNSEGGTNGTSHFGRHREGETTWAGFSNGGNLQQNQAVQTPSTHRQRLASGIEPLPSVIHDNSRGNSVSRIPNLQVPRQPLSRLSGNNASPSGFAGYGMSAGMKVSNPTGAVSSGLARSAMRSRVAQRLGPGLSSNGDTEHGPPPTPNMFSNGQRYY